MNLAFSRDRVCLAPMGVLFVVERQQGGQHISERPDPGASGAGARSGVFKRAIATVLGGLVLVVFLPLYGAFLLVSIAVSGLWRAARASVRAAQRALHHRVSRHRTNP